ncbi:MAG: holo-[acyl-carrier-protein] synthase [Aquificae bacterium]|nr:holo-[acyl-carrier-protein] synthase [Aquificota bacterium]
MDIYTGIDIVENSRVQRVLEKYKDRFLNKLYTSKETQYCLSKTDYIPCLSSRFAVKEAFVKAFFQYSGEILPYLSIEVLGERGKPATVVLHPKNERIKGFLNRIKYTISLSHEKNYSVAVVVIYTK